MHRTASGSRVSDQFFTVPSPSPPQSQSQSSRQSSTAADHQQLLLPRYDPLSHAAKREKSRLRSAENAIHLIPLVLVLCAVILWFFSHPASRS